MSQDLSELIHFIQLISQTLNDPLILLHMRESDQAC